MASHNHKLKTIAVFLFISVTALSLATNSAAQISSPVRGNKLVEQICTKKGNLLKKSFCLDTFNTDPRIASATNISDLFDIAMDQGIRNTTKNRQFFLESVKSMPELASALQFCASRLDRVVKTLKRAVRLVAEGPTNNDLTALAYDVELAFDYSEQCEERMDAEGVRDDGLLSRSGDTMNYALLCYELTVAVSG